ncbi:hypothetical protein J7F03_30240 [Streptomyces sp. ISL-43]|uniref:hypothetical protein n=1 Tax=Streptomyces sp. ISL-43 TaxID=2819183 RepID=UPI001BE5A65E|nr:hypothetical protein [Streptomyces sp. ISL-43]MBT2451274.1 hypothetical protein [Streptomyces sp. ISL-43]
MFTEEQLNQLRGLLAPMFEAHAQASKKEHEELGVLISGLAEHTDKAIEAAHQKTVEVLTNRMKVTFEHQDQRITRVEKHLNLPPLD